MALENEAEKFYNNIERTLEQDRVSHNYNGKGVGK